MKRPSLIHISIAFMWFAGSILHASALVPPSFSQDAPQDEKPRAQEASQRSDNLELTFEGLKHFAESDLRKVLLERRANISKEDIKDPVKLQKAETTLKEYLAARGYLNANVTIRQERVPGIGETISFVVNEGERSRVAEVQFDGNVVFPNQQLLESMKSAGEDSKDYCSFRDGYDSDVFEVCMRRVQFYMRSKGYLKAKLDEPKKQETEGGLKLIVPVTEGELYRIGELRIEGTTVFTPEQIFAMLDLKTGDVADGVAIGHWLQQELKDAYNELGYVQYEYDVDPTFRSHPENAKEGVVDFQITITEGRKFIIGKIDFKGQTPMSDAELRRLLTINEGEPYSQKALIESVRNLYELGLSDGDPERDVDYRSDEEEGLLDIAFVLKGYHRQPPNNDASPVVKRRTSSPN